MMTGFLVHQMSVFRKKIIQTLLIQLHHLKEIELQRHKLPRIVIYLELGDLQNDFEGPLSCDLKKKGM